MIWSDSFKDALDGREKRTNMEEAKSEETTVAMTLMPAFATEWHSNIARDSSHNQADSEQ